MNKVRLWLLLIILIALALRLYNLTYHSLWFDEAISVHWARQSVPRILDVGFTLVEDRLPPLYYLMLKGWTSLFGRSEAAVRSLSVVFGVLLIPVLAGVARSLFNRQVALKVSLLAALNPFLLWYAQEARMYAPAVFFGTLAVWAFLGLCQSLIDDSGPESHDLPRLHAAIYVALFIIAGIAGLYTHLYTGFLLPALGVWLIISHPRVWKLWILFIVSGLVMTVAFAPIAVATWRFSGDAVPGDPLHGIGQRAGWLVQAFTVWNAPLPEIIRIAIPAIIILTALAAFLPLRLSTGDSSISNLRNALLLVALLVLCPFAIANLLLLRNHLAFFGERYFIVTVPWLLLLVAVGTEKVGRWLQRGVGNAVAAGSMSSRLALPDFTVLPFALILVVTMLPIPGQWTIAAAKEAWRQSVSYIAETVRPNDGILIHPDWVRFPFQFYFEGPGQTYAAFSTVGPKTALDGPLQGVVGDHSVIWLIQSHLDGPDPNRRVEQWFASRYPLVTELYPPGIALKGYATDYQLEALPPEATPVDIRLQNGLHLVGYEADQVASASDLLFHPPSGWVHVVLYWTAEGPISEAARPVVRLVGPEGVWGVSLDRENDALRLFPPPQWPVETGKRLIVRHDLDVNLNPATPPGIYQLQIGLPGTETMHPLAKVEVR